MSRIASVLLTLAFSTTLFAQVPRSHHVVVVTMENHSYEQVIGNTSMPYYNQLASQYGLATQYYSTEHDSITGLMWLVAGTWIIHNDSTTLTFDQDNIVREINNAGAGRTWKVYASNLPSIGYLGDGPSPYLRRHNPLSYFTDVHDNPAQAQNMVPADPYFQQDIANGTLPDYSYVVPDADEDAHDGTLAMADTWLSENIPQLLASPQFQQDGILIIVWDEGTLSPIGNYTSNDSRGEALDPAELVYTASDPGTIWAIPGGRTATLVIGPSVKPGFQSQSFYNAQNLLRTVCDAMILNACPGNAATAVPMTDFFVGNPDTPPRQPLEVVISSPTTATFNSSTGTATPVHLIADAVDRISRRVTGMIAYLDDQNVAGGNGVTHIDTTLSLSPGTHKLVVTGWSWETSVVSGVPDKLVHYSTTRMLTVGTGIAPALVAGNVTDISTGKAIAGATVTLAGQTASSDANGGFSFNSVNPGSYTLTAAATGYFQESAAVNAVSGTTAAANVQLPTGGQVIGQVIANGSALANATISLSGGSVATAKTVTTDSTGAFSSNWVPVGNYSVSVNAAGFPAQTATTMVTTGARSTVNFTLNSYATVSGRITDISSGKAIAGATVNLAGRTASSDVNGAFSFSNVTAGSYTLTAVASGYFRESAAVTAVAGSIASANVQLPTGGQVIGQVTGNGTPLGNATITITGGSVTTTKTLTTDSTGSFSSNWVPVGSYTVSVNASGFPGQSATASVTTGAKSTVNFTLSSHASVSGKVTDISTGKAIAGATVKMATLQTTTDINGNYTLSLNAGSATGSAVASGYFSSTRTLSLVAGANTANFQLPTGGKLAGTVKNSAGVPVANATVTINGGVVHTSITTTTSSTGTYKSNWVPVGSYSLTVASAGSSQAASANVSTGNTTTLNVQLP